MNCTKECGTWKKFIQENSVDLSTILDLAMIFHLCLNCTIPLFPDTSLGSPTIQSL
uniref:Bm13548, isoform a n=1 Tax=Brugia malayi TaxID=6279 RepID=A0A1I9G4Q5_BRUMA|nr:Bm13548, isoform a [Brugia malayi]